MAAVILAVAGATPAGGAAATARTTAAQVGVSVVTQHDDNARTGANLDETTLSTANVNSSQFGLLFKRAVDGEIYAQPLYVPAVAIPGQGTHNVVYVATMHNTVYAFDADDASASAPLWSVNLGPSVPPHDFGAGYNDIDREIGILSTPVIDLSSGTMYVVAYSKENGYYIYRLHALDITTGAEKLGGPVTISASAAGSGAMSINGVIAFDAHQELQRPGLLLSDGVVYIAFGSHGDYNPFHGWVLGYDAATLRQVFAFDSTSDGAQGGIWQAGQGLAADAAGNVYLASGNGDFTANGGGSSYGDSFVKLGPPPYSGGVAPVSDWFAPHDQDNLDVNDLDLGSSGPLLLPGTSLLVGGGKEGKLYVLDTSPGAMGHYNATDDSQIPQSFQATALSGDAIRGSPVYWNGPGGPFLYVWGEDDYLKAFRMTGGITGTVFQTTPASASTMTGGTGCPGNCLPGGILSVSANGSTPGSGIVWATTPADNCDAAEQTCPGILRAFDASDVSHELWDSRQDAARDDLGAFAKYNPPTIANGKVYAPTFSGYLAVYGLLPAGSSCAPAAATWTPTASATATPPDTSNGLAAAFNNAGISNPQTISDTNFDGGGNSYDAGLLQAAGLAPGSVVNAGGAGLTWPDAVPGALDNVVAQGQVITLPSPVGGSALALLGAASGGPASGAATISYADGTTSTATIGFSDWTLNAGTMPISFSNTIVATTAYQNHFGGGTVPYTTYVFLATVPLASGSPVVSVALPSVTSPGQLHIFAMAVAGASPTATATDTSPAVTGTSTPTSTAPGGTACTPTPAPSPTTVATSPPPRPTPTSPAVPPTATATASPSNTADAGATPTAPSPAVQLTVAGPTATATATAPACGSCGAWRRLITFGGARLEAISCPDARHCYVVGRQGLILATRDGGRSWRAQLSGTGRDLRGVTCANALSCVAVGDRGAIVRTTDGGAIWASATSANRSIVASLDAVACPTRALCYAVGESSAVVASADGGRTWHTPRRPTLGLPGLNAIDCPGPRTCYAVGGLGTILTTSDGATWHAHRSPLGGGAGAWQAIRCESARRCLIAGDDGQIASTADGGRTWQRRPAPVSPTATLFSLACSSGVCDAAGFDAMAGPRSDVILASSTGGATWIRQSPGTPAELHALSCWSAHACMAVAWDGVVDTDAPVTSATRGVATFQKRPAPGAAPAGRWRLVHTGSARDLSAVSCAGARTCVAVGDGGTILVSHDGGRAWAPARSGVSKPLAGVSCPTVSICVAAGGSYQGRSYQAIVATHDGGRTWRRQSSPFDEALTSVACADAAHCYAVGLGGVILRTVDGGATWLGTRTPYLHLLGIACSDAASCVAVGMPASFGAGSPASSIVAVTTNGGRNWHRALTPASRQVYYLLAVSCPRRCLAVGWKGAALADGTARLRWSLQHTGAGGADLATISCPDERHCLVAGGDRIVATSDGGARWATRAVPRSSVISGVNGLACWSAQGCVAVGPHGIIVRTVDGGRQWAVARSTLPESYADLGAAACATARECFAAGVFGTLLASGDGGARWSAGRSGSAGTSITVTSMACPRPARCVAAGVGTSGAGITWQFDGGHGWQSMSRPGAALYGLACPTEEMCYGVGARGTTLTSSDGGRSWVSRPNELRGSDTSLLAVACPRVNACLAVGENGAILSTVDSGHTWQGRFSGVQAALRGVACPRVDMCLAAGDGGAILVSSDGGRTWHLRASGTTQPLAAIACSGPRDCTAVGAGGAVVATGDGGATWHRQDSRTAEDLNAIACRAASPCIASGAFSTIVVRGA